MKAPTEESSSRRVLLIGTRPPPINGQSVAFDMLLSGLRAQELPVDVIDISERAGRRDRDFSFARVVQILRLAVSVWMACRRSGLVYLTIAQSRWGFVRDALLIWTALLARRPVILHLHGGNYGGFFSSEVLPIRAAIRLTLRQASRIIVLSEGLKQDFAFLGPDRAERIRIVPNGCMVPVGQPRHLPTKEIRLLYLSNLLAQKGYLDCIDALVEIRRRLPEHPVKLVLAGSFMLGEDEYASPHEMERSLRKHIRYLEVDPFVEIVGSVEGDRKRELLESSHIFVLPTYYRNEGQPISLLEAMSSALPPVVTSWRGISEIVEHNKNGMIVPSQDPIAIADATVRLVLEDGLYERISAATAQAAAGFTPAIHVKAMRDVFDDCLSGAASRRARAAGT